MQNKGVVVGLTIIITALCLYYLSFTFVSRRVQSDAIAYATDANGTVNLLKKVNYLDSVWNQPVYNLFGAEYTYKEVKENELSLGLDLQGGMHVVLEVSPVEIIRGLAGNNANDPAFVAAIQQARAQQAISQDNFSALFFKAFKEANPDRKLASLFASSANKDKVSISDDDGKVQSFVDAEIEDAIGRSFTILKTRIDQFGTSQPNIQRLQGTGRIQIEIPGADNPQRVRKLLQGVARLEFWEVADFGNDQQLATSLGNINTLLTNEQTAKAKAQTASGEDTVSTPADSTQSALEKQLSSATDSTGSALDSLRNAMTNPLFNWSQNIPFLYNVKDTAKVNRILRRDDIRSMLGNGYRLYWDVKADPDVTPGVEDIQLNFLKANKGKPLLTGEVINDARQDYDQYGKPAVTMTMDPNGTRAWAKITKAASEQRPQGRVAIVLDNYVYTAPTVQGEIPNGNSQITGRFEIEEAVDLANVLKAGSLPAPTRIVEEAIVGPTLGQVAQNQGLISMACGLGLVVLFMIAYYAKGGWVANIALLFNIFFILGILAQFNAALTLPGIAGIVLTMGMAVDANVLIYERIKEELKHGIKVKEAIRKGYKNAFATIFDSNLTTFITAAALFILGSGPLKGFAIVLMIGIATSFFSAVYISRVFIEWMTRKGDDSKISFETPLANVVRQRKHFDFVGVRKIGYVFSVIFIGLGFAIIAFKGMNLGVDFKGGRSYTVSFTQPVRATDLKVSLTQSFENAGTEVKNFGSNNVMKVTTSYLVDDESTEADEKVQGAMIAAIEKFSGKTFVDEESALTDGTFTISSSSKVGATIADDIKNSAFKASLVSLLLIFLYILVRFKRWQFSAGAIIATVHDTLFVIAAFAILSLFGISFEIDQIFVAAVLTIIGYSINDTVIIFDRIREYLGMGTSHDRKRIFNEAINTTLSRTIITGGTTLIVVLVLLIFGGEVLRGFSFALVLGIVMGTYSSIFIAAPVVLDLDPSGESDKPADKKEPKAVAAV